MGLQLIFTKLIEMKPKFVSLIQLLFVQYLRADSQYQGVITLISKPDKNHLLVCNYRLITLLTCDYRIISKSLTNRLTNLLHRFVSNEQSKFTKGWYVRNIT